ncbi:hypothetical protein MicloDRAFT_00070360 [Microvirga lotononidis]|uniref:Uncharacterized protein n=1 Tax=Microvirga lotononidis TaxID=864069 RepID=I4YK91_9HYPH|nr:hypothetical protein MicloDRAFT_00070360 [Microvirga lotononidis]
MPPDTVVEVVDVTAEPLRLEDAVSRIAVEMRQEVRDREGEVIEQKAGGLAQSADDRPLFLGGFSGQLARPAAMILTVMASRLRHLRMLSVLNPKCFASTPADSAERAIS